jgi:hypothetical protein
VRDLEKEKLKELRKVFRAIINDLIKDLAGGRHIIGNTDIPLIIANKLLYEVKIRVPNK